MVINLVKRKHSFRAINRKFSLHINRAFHVDVTFEVVVRDYVITILLHFYPLGLQFGHVLTVLNS